LFFSPTLRVPFFLLLGQLSGLLIAPAPNELSSHEKIKIASALDQQKTDLSNIPVRSSLLLLGNSEYEIAGDFYTS